MMNEFYIGQQVYEIIYPSNECYTVGIGGIEKITVVMEDGQMAGVPWFAVWKNGEIESKHNAVHVSTVIMSDPRKDQK